MYLQILKKKTDGAGKLVSSVCHGAELFVGPVDAQGVPIVKGKVRLLNPHPTPVAILRCYHIAIPSQFNEAETLSVTSAAGGWLAELCVPRRK